MLTVDAHPLLEVAAVTTSFHAPLGGLPSSGKLKELLSAASEAPLSSDDAVRAAVRDLLRHGGYKPTGRGKPASEYLIRASTDGSLSSINVAVDACNAVSLHSGVPISLVDLDRVTPPLRVAVAAPGAKYVFNASGQELDLAGLLCLFDAEGPCANAVKDSQRTKTHGATSRTLAILWGAKALGDRTRRAAEWYRALLEELGATSELVPLGG